jgi:hypothetical protein
MKIVEVVWRDILSSDGWHNQNKIDKFISNSSDEVVQVGYLYEEDEHQVVLLDNYFKDKTLYGTIHRIPRGCIVDIKYL